MRNLPGDEWMYAREPDTPPPTRVELQARIDWEYGTGKIDQETWSKRFDELSKMEMLPADEKKPD